MRLSQGTANFMAVEVDKGMYLFRGKQLSVKKATETGSEKEKLDLYVKLLAKARDRAEVTEARGTHTEENNGAVRSESKPKTPFRYNPTHDLESVLWIAIYFVVNMETSIANTWDRLADDQLRFARSLFYGGEARILAMTIPEDSPLDKHMQSLGPHLTVICKALIELRGFLCEHYLQIESPGFIIDNMVCSELYEKFMAAFERMLEKLEEDDIVVAPLGHDPRVSPEQDNRT
jgi:hypothetical protein